jgi:hypothetical protein
MSNTVNESNVNGSNVNELSNLNPKLQMDINELVHYLENFIGEGVVNILNILNICVVAMQKVEKFNKLSGSDKKQVVLGAISQIIKNKGGDDNLTTLLPSFIDTSISIEKGELNISINGKKCCASIFSLFQK